MEINVKNLLKIKKILKTQQRFKSERRNLFTEAINKIALSTNDHNRIQSIDSTEAYAHGTSKDIIYVKLKE